MPTFRPFATQIRQIESERNDLRQRLDKSEDERRTTQTKLTALLTDQREVKPAVRPWWWW